MPKQSVIAVGLAGKPCNIAKLICMNKGDNFGRKLNIMLILRYHKECIMRCFNTDRVREELGNTVTCFTDVSVCCFLSFPFISPSVPQFSPLSYLPNSPFSITFPSTFSNLRHPSTLSRVTFF